MSPGGWGDGVRLKVSDCGPITAQLSERKLLRRHLVNKVVHGDDGGRFAWVAVDQEAAPGESERETDRHWPS